MTRTLWLHIGTHKTGTTAIQSAFHKYSDDGLRYLALPHPNHSFPILTMFQTDPERFFSNARVPYPYRDFARNRPKLLHRFKQLLEQDRRDIVISGESMSRPGFAGGHEALLDFCRPHFDRVQVVVYLREPVSFVTSMLAERMKTTPTEFRPVPEKAMYRARLEHWIDAVGRDNVHVRPFHRGAFGVGGVVADFGAVVGVTKPLPENKGSNISPSTEALAVTNHYLRKPAGVLGQQWNRYLSILAREFPGHPLAIPTKRVALYLRANSDDIAWAERLLGEPFQAYESHADAIEVRDDEVFCKIAEDALPAFRKWVAPKVITSLPWMVRKVLAPK
ncbi:hypothetical protein BXY66_0791 [Shimia isoporae]|uniref:Sulfotransferase family protein n=1 Tax=Shimia isoporae TaxID=647720 RepID=A0A4R1NQ08_9RHOB|nr:hypothetical protein [Shimia isoporae]TCL08753.1 hypothetical protein BXY66_0791 [Shimia isoporae]